MTIANKLAELVQAAAKLYHESYDNEAADAASAQADLDRAANPGNIYAGCVDYKKFYTLTMRQACENACIALGEPRLGEPVYLMLDSWWNDVLDWSKAVISNDQTYFDHYKNNALGLDGIKLDNFGPRGVTVAKE